MEKLMLLVILLLLMGQVLLTFAGLLSRKQRNKKITVLYYLINLCSIFGVLAVWLLAGAMADEGLLISSSSYSLLLLLTAGTGIGNLIFL